MVLGAGERAVQVLPGSEVTIAIETNKPVVQAKLMMASVVLQDAAAEPSGYRTTISPTETQLYHFHLVDEHGLEDKQPVRFSVRMLKDDPPHARLKMPMAGAMITAEAILPIDLEYTDTYGLATAELWFRVTREADSTEGAIELPEFVTRATSFSQSISWPVARSGVSAAPETGCC
jgi:hypothetical protein